MQADLVVTPRPLADQVSAALTRERMVAALSALFGGLALVLAGLGLYGVTSFAVSQRRAEIAVRMALGATTRQVLSHVLTRILTLVALGLGIGVGVSLWATRFVSPLLPPACDDPAGARRTEIGSASGDVRDGAALGKQR